MARRRQGLRAQVRTWNHLTREIKRAAENARPRCGCPANKPEADPDKFACPCGSHCLDPECQRINKTL